MATPNDVELSVTARRLDLLVKESGLARTEFARRCNVSYQSLYQSIRGYRNLSDALVYRIARKCDVDAAWLRGDIDDRE